ncbi:hypothetical protein CHS0354_017356 [Potamilus streckersoni]|uniref:Secreted protein n=1 Tax=Potamilus streckersoni TaxID=2493646 RepID=A0AAE0T5I8_9BIVA|nr:hypothetical protein CHS0354_017356 [Potamilus streckersoni]
MQLKLLLSVITFKLGLKSTRFVGFVAEDALCFWYTCKKNSCFEDNIQYLRHVKAGFSCIRLVVNVVSSQTLEFTCNILPPMYADSCYLYHLGNL